jgi:carboxymethylenebutenolidase
MLAPRQKTKIPAEAVELYSRYIHGEVGRRSFFEGLKKFAVAGLTTSALVEALMPNYALGQQIRKDDERIVTSYETVPSPMGNGFMRGYLARPFSAISRAEEETRLPGVIVIHENRGLNPHTEDIARRFALENFVAFAPDALSPVGGYPGDDFRGGQLFAEIDRPTMLQDFIAVSRWLKAHPACSGGLAATGFCFGGGMALTLAVELGEDMNAVAPYYGNPPSAEDVRRIRAAVLVHHGALDMRLSSGWPQQQADMEAAGVTNEGHIYPDSVHGFFNDATPERYNRAAAEQSWTRTIEWFNQYARMPA